MRKLQFFVCGLTVSFAGLLSSAAYAGSAADALGLCMIDKTSEQDRVELVQWVFSSFAAHPATQEIGTVSAQAAVSIDKNVAQLVTRLFTDDCRLEFRKAISEEGEVDAFKTGFRALGQVAAMELMRHPDVDISIQQFTQYLDEERIRAITK